MRTSKNVVLNSNLQKSFLSRLDTQKTPKIRTLPTNGSTVRIFSILKNRIFVHRCEKNSQKNAILNDYATRNATRNLLEKALKKEVSRLICSREKLIFFACLQSSTQNNSYHSSFLSCLSTYHIIFAVFF